MGRAYHSFSTAYILLLPGRGKGRGMSHYSVVVKASNRQHSQGKGRVPVRFRHAPVEVYPVWD